MKKFTHILLSASFLLWGISSCSSSKNETEKPADETVTADMVTSPTADTKDTLDVPDVKAEDTLSFALLAASADLLEVMSSEQALTKAKRQETKNFAQQMITEHQKSYQELKTITAAKNQTVPTEMLPGHQKMYAKFMEKDLDEFDNSYMELQVTLHRDALHFFEDAANNHQDTELRAYANRTLPNLRNHLELAKKIEDQVD